MNEYEDEYFLEEDKILYNDGTYLTHLNNTTQNVTESIETISKDETIKDFGTMEIIDEVPEIILGTSIDNPDNNTVLKSDSEIYNRNFQQHEMLRLGMTVTSGSVIIKKDQTNLIGISIGGGAPYCPCVYIVQIFDGTPTAKDGTLQSGDELLSINGNSVKGKTKVEVAKMIQSTENEVTIIYNKLHATANQGDSLDIVLKKMKHRFVENLSSSTADSLGLSRAILCNDSLVKRLQELQATETMYRGLVEHAKRMLKAYFDLLQTYQAFGNCFNAISVREPQARASETFRLFGEIHKCMERDGIQMIKTIKPVLNDFGTYLTKAIPDTKMTIRRYADAKFTYLSYCLKVKEMDDEEHSYAALQEPIYRVETGNYEYRLILRCRQEARCKFASLRNDVLEKLELLENKHVTDLVTQLKRFIQALTSFSNNMVTKLNAHPNLFPVEVDLQSTAFQYKSAGQIQQNQKNCNDDGDDEIIDSNNVYEEVGVEVNEISLQNIDDNQKKSLTDSSSTTGTGTVQELLLPGFEEISLNNTNDSKNKTEQQSNDDLLKELGLADIDLSIGSTFTIPSLSSVNSSNIVSNFDLLN